ncbi:MAG: hypothetical protein HXX09_00645 [Bacteroidetes bacterium]|nr:hypothetical protein [Bacteroidota bacterium]
MKKLLVIAMVAFVSQIFTANTFAQDVKKVEIKAKSVEKTRGQNPHIKAQMPTTDENPQQDPALDQQKTRGKKDCSINVVNNTGFMVEVYVDGVSKGVVDAWAETTVKARTGYKTIYAITTGQTKEWFADGDCNGTYSFVLLAGGDKDK